MISIIIPTYRNPEYLDICLKSAIEQQHHSNEIIVAVDGFHEDVELGFEVALLVLHCLNLSVEL